MDNFQPFLENRQIGRSEIAASVKTVSPAYENWPALHALFGQGPILQAISFSSVNPKNREPAVKLKYIIISHNEIEVPLVFPPLLLHEKVAKKCQVISAGFCGMDETGKWIVGGRSTSLNLSARPQDAGILNTHLGAGGSFEHAAGHVATQAARQGDFASSCS